jgi:hypothetical protein
VNKNEENKKGKILVVSKVIESSWLASNVFGPE